MNLQLNREHHPDTLSTVANLASVYVCQAAVSCLGQPLMESMVDKITNDLWIIEREMVKTAESHSIELLTTLLDHFNDRVPITEEVVRVAARYNCRTLRQITIQ